MKLHELGIERFTRIVSRKLEEYEYNIVLENPQTDETFPCGVLSNVMRKDTINEDGEPVKSSFSFTLEWWTEKTYSSMALFDKSNIKLRELNILLTGNTSPRFDEVTKKYIVGGNYEVNYNAITNSFNKIR